MKKNILLFIAIIIANILLISGCNGKVAEIKSTPRAVNGILDLSNWDFQKDGVIRLEGQWEFYWNQFLDPTDFQNGKLPEITGHIDVPSTWNKYKINGEKLSGNGYATYRLLIKTSNNLNNGLGLKIPRIFTAYSLWSDGRLIASSGKISKTSEHAVPQYYPKIVMLNPSDHIVELIVQISNFSHRSGGMLESIILGSQEDIIKSRENKLSFELFLFGTLLIMGVYHIVLYISRRNNLPPLFFGSYCLLIATRTLFVGEIFIIQLFPSLNWELQHKIQTLTFYIGVPIFIKFIKSVFPHDVPKITLVLSQIAGAVFGLLVLFTPARIFTVFNPLYQLITAIIIGLLIFSLIMACIRKRKGSLVIASGGIFFILTAINDILFLSVPFNDYNFTFLRSIIVTGNLSSFGLIVLVFSQSIVLVVSFSKAFAQVEEMSGKLILAGRQKDELLTTLEYKVKERTLELEKVLEDLKRTENSRKRFIANISHDLKTPMTLILGYSEAIIDGMVNSKKDVDKYLKLIQNKIHVLKRLADDLFELCQLESRNKKLDLAKISLSSLFAKIEKKYRYDVEKAGLQFTLKAPENSEYYFKIDFNQINRVFSNLIYNAVKYSQDGEICISCCFSTNEAIFAVSDKGAGISEEDLPNLFDRYYTTSTPRNSSKKGSGLGLAIAKEIVEYHGGSIWFESKLGQGSTFYFSLKLLTEPSDEFV
ncbi:MAG: sensor histidine kinase [Acetivibrionales bacterium]